ncbi:hypothetical protein [Neobacillus jeddahensis]|uniref:hypothetical protein n=1 Tax=Neobacillus jeddahensis TaxID=1461580 RepID=UPI0005AAB029|nr:hypothetical protein [Neobacillus jeddahensis]
MKNKSNKVVYTSALPEGVAIGVESNIVVGTKKVFTETDKILMEVAKRRLWELEDHNGLYESGWCKEAMGKTIVLFDQIRRQVKDVNLTEEDLFEFESATCDHNVAFGESQFIQGYLEGYKFAKQMFENKKERAAVTDVPFGQL